MIHLSNEEQIRKSIGSNQHRIASQFKGDDILEKAMPLEDFDKKYPAETYERYAYTEIAKFRDDFMKSEDANEENLKATLDGLSQVLVSDNGMATIVYVKEKEAAAEAEEEV